MNTEALQKIEEYKTHITNLSAAQNKLYDDLVTSLQLDDKLEDFVFDYVYNETRYDSFQQYLERYNVMPPLFQQ
jgi:hypothetical protein